MQTLIASLLLCEERAASAFDRAQRRRFLTASSLVVLALATGCAVNRPPTTDTDLTTASSGMDSRRSSRPICEAQRDGKDDVVAAGLVIPLPPVAIELPPALARRLQPPTQTTSAGIALVAHQSMEISAERDPGPQLLQAELLPPAKSVEPAKLTLDQVINACLIADPTLRAGFEAINQANADALTASLKPNPILFMDGQLLPLTRPFTVDRQGGPPQQDINLSLPIDWFLFGKRAAAMASASLGVRVSRSEYADRIRLRVTDAAIAFYDVLEAKALLDVALQDVTNLKRVETVTSKAVADGGRAQVELNRVRLDLLNSRRVSRDAVATVVTNKARLRTFLGRSDADPTFDIDGTLDIRASVEPPQEEEAFEIAMRNRPDLQALRWKVARARADIESERRKGRATIAPQFGYTRQYQTKAIGFPDANSWSGALTMSLPLHDRNQGNVSKAASMATQNRRDLFAGEVELRAEVESVLQELRTARANADAVAHEQLQLARQVRDSIVQAYEAGGRPLLDVLDAQRNYRETFRTFIISRANYWRAVHRFNAVIAQQVTP